ncbi:MAG: putative lipid II flippase FtsW [Clostridia bacterium]|nr:putative lipid II flippase FtsW [Clostridia bacterium]
MKRDKRLNLYGKIDVPLTITTLILTIFGVVMVYSASSYNAQINYGNQFYYMIKQIIGVVLGVVALIFCSLTDYHALIKLRYPVLFVSFVLLILVFIPGIGVENYGAKRWINLPFFTIQASEIAKFGFIIFTASYLSKNYNKIDKFRTLIPPLFIGGIMCLLIILEPNMSVTMCVGALMILMLFIGGAKIKHLAILFVPIVALVPILIIVEPYRLQRLLAFIDPWKNPLEEGYQLIQSFYAISSGGLFGVGLFNSRQKYLFLPFSESDFIFSVIAEELGLFGVIIVITLFCVVIFRAIKISREASDRFGCYLAGGVASLIAIQVLINVAVVSGSIPPTGLPLPFISAGSSSLIVFCASIGVLNSVKRFSHKSIKRLIR